MQISPTSWYHLSTGRECVIASQFLCTSKSVLLLQSHQQLRRHGEKADVLCRKQENLQRCRDDSTLCQGRVEGRHPRPPPPTLLRIQWESSEIDRMISAQHGRTKLAAALRS
jgi:hypothetical protein